MPDPPASQAGQQRASGSSSSPLPSSTEGVYQDPRSLLTCYPLPLYQPIARTALHIAPHTTVHHTPASSTDLYRQYADAFGRMDNPQTTEDWAARTALEMQVRGMLDSAGSSYSTHYHPSPFEDINVPPGAEPAYGTTYGEGPPPLPYKFLPNYMPPISSFQQPPTPTSLAGSGNSPSAAAGHDEYFEAFVDRALRRAETPQHSEAEQSPGPSAHPKPGPSSVTSTPTIARTLANTVLTPGESPDPLSLPGPSPSKRSKTRRNGDESPTKRPKRLSPPQTSISKHTPQSMKKQGKAVLVVEVPVKRRPGLVASTTPGGDDFSEDSDEDGPMWEDGTKMKLGDWQMEESFRYRSPDPLGSSVPPGSGRTGERDTRTHLQRLQNFLEDVFEESDSFSAEPTSDEIRRSKFFISSEKDGALPLLSTKTTETLTRYVRRGQSGKGWQSHDGTGIDWDTESIARILQLLERSMREAEGLSDLVQGSKYVKENVPTQKRSRKKEIEASKSKSSTSPGEDSVQLPQTDDKQWDEETLRGYEVRLATCAAAALAAEASMLLLDTNGLPKQLLSEDILLMAVMVIKDNMQGIILPAIEAIAGEKLSSGFLGHLQHVGFSPDKKQKAANTSSLLQHPQIAVISRSTCSVIPHLTSLLSRTDMAFSDSLIIHTVYFVLSPLFITESIPKKGRKKETISLKGESDLSTIKQLRMESLGCLRAIFARYEEQRQWILEEILGSMVKVSDQNKKQTRYPVPGGISIHTISALLLQIVQSSASGVSKRIQKLRSSLNTMEQGASTGNAEGEIDMAEHEAQLCNDTIDSALRSARVVAGYLVQKSTPSRGDKSSHDAEYKAVLDIFVADLLAVLYRPEWPAASLYLSVISRLFISALDDPKSDSANKSAALDYLGEIAARLRVLHMEMLATPSVRSMDEIVSEPDSRGASALLKAHATIQSHLASCAQSDAMFADSMEMSSALWAQELHLGVQKVVSVVERLSAERSEEARATLENLQIIGQHLRSALQGVWTTEAGLFDVNDREQAESASHASLAVSRGQSLQAAFDPILHALIATMNTSQVALRSKALRGLTGIVTIDSTVLGLPSVRQVLEDRLSDGSPQVRDAAVELVGKYIAHQTELINDYYPHIVLRVDDTGLGVRKRVIKLLRDIYLASSSQDTRVDIVSKLILLIGDKDESVKELATTTLTDILFPPRATDFKQSADLLVNIVGEWQDTSNLLQQAIEEVGKVCSVADQDMRFAGTIDALFGKLVDATEDSDFDALSHIRATQLLTWSRPGLVNLSKASILLTYLRHPPNNADEQVANDLLLRIFRRSIPLMPRTASTFASDLSKLLLPMINKPTGGLQGLKEVIGCFCILVNHLTKDYGGLLKILKACEGKIRAMRNEWTTKQTSVLAALPAAPMMLYITALIAEHCDLDALTIESDLVKQTLRQVAGTEPFHQHLFETFLDFTDMPIPQGAPTSCLGSLFKAYSSLILRDETTAWINRVFASNDDDNQARVLNVIHEFLHAESDKKTMGDGSDKTIGALIGGTTDLNDAAVSTLVVQRNIDHIFNGAKSQSIPTQRAALDVLGFTVNQGLYHPLQCLPVLVSLETSEIPEVAERALILHATLHSKHPSHVNVRYLDFARHSYEYQRQITSEPSGERDGAALLAGWYALVSEKKQSRNEFLKGMARAFEYDMSRKDVPNVGFVLYVAENLVALEYRLQEEVMSVIQQLGHVISLSQDLAAALEEAQVDGVPEELIIGRPLTMNQKGDPVDAEVAIHCSIVVSLAILAKNHFLDMYSLSEDKCIKHVIGKKSALGDKPAVRRSHPGLDTSAMPYVRGVKTVAEFASQRATFLHLLEAEVSFDKDSP